MKDKFFLDTNLFVYTFDKETPNKRQIAQDLLIKALHSKQGCISWQVIQEFMNVSRHKFSSPLNATDCNLYLNEVLEPLCEIYPSIDLFQKALTVSERWQYRFFDSLIICAALKAGCNILHSEDLQHEQKIDSIRILNPFK